MEWDAHLFARLVQEHGGVTAVAAATKSSVAAVKNWMPPAGPTGEHRTRVLEALDVPEAALFRRPGDETSSTESPVQADRIEAKLDEALAEITAVKQRVYFRGLDDEMPGVSIAMLPGQDGESRYALVDDDGWVVATITMADPGNAEQAPAVERAEAQLHRLASGVSGRAPQGTSVGGAEAAMRAAAAGRRPSGEAPAQSPPKRRARGR